jgi:membrane associated rhomboid family serine protease
MSISIVLIAISVIASLYAWKHPDIYNKWMMNPYAVIHKRQYFRLITSGFIHNGYVHLLFNMITLYFFGDVIEQVFRYYYGGKGIFYFLLLYFLGMLVADIPSLVKYKDNPNYNSLGASGAVSAVLFASILFNPTAKVCIFLPLLCIPGFIFGILFLLYSYYQGRKMSDNINHDAHFYGAVFGIIFGIVIEPGVIVSFFDQILNYKIF